MEEVAAIEQARTLWADGDRRAALDLLLEHARTHRTDAAARRALVDFYREMGAPDQAGRWGITLDDVVSELETDRLARLLAGSRAWGADVSEILALPKGRRPVVVEELVAGPVEQYWQRMLDRMPDYAPPSKPEPFVNASVNAWLVSVALLLLGLVALWVVAGLGLLDTRLFARALAALVAASVGVALMLSGMMLAVERKRSAVGWILGGLLLIVTVVAASIATRLTYVF